MGVLDMLNPALVLKLRLIVYGILIFFSFFIFVGVAVMKDKTDISGVSCPLYLDIKNNRFDAGPESNCGYPMAISIMYQLLYLLFRVGTLVLVLLGKFTADMVLFSDLAELVYVIVDLSAFFLIFIAACILSAGTNHTCNSKYIHCDHEDISDAISASKAAQAGAWISTFLWLFIGICGFITLWRAGKIPFLQGGGAAKSDSTATGPDSNQPPIETPPYNPDEPPKY